MNLFKCFTLSRQSFWSAISRMKYRSFNRDLRPELIAIEVAVSTLSPVNIQI